MSTDLHRDVRILKVYAVLSTAAILALGTLGMTSSRVDRQHFEEIDVERVNVVEADGRLRMVLSNEERQHPGIVDGDTVPRDHARPAGILFFNHRGDEAGGLVVGRNGAPDGTGHFVSFTMDKSRHDQTVALQHLESDDGSYFAGFRIVDRPNVSLHETIDEIDRVRAIEDSVARDSAIEALRRLGHLGARRITIARSRDTSAEILLADSQGRPRLVLSVSADGTPGLRFLDETGAVTRALP